MDAFKFKISEKKIKIGNYIQHTIDEMDTKFFVILF